MTELLEEAIEFVYDHDPRNFVREELDEQREELDEDDLIDYIEDTILEYEDAEDYDWLSDYKPEADDLIKRLKAELKPQPKKK